MKEIRDAQKGMIDILGGESIRDWEKALLRTADARPAATEADCRFALSLLPVKQEKNHEALGKKVTDIIRAAFNRVETPTFSGDQNVLLGEQIRERHMPAVDFLSTATDDHDVVVMSDTLADEEYPAFADLITELYDEAGFSHIALPVAPEEAEQFDEFLGSAPEKSSEALFDDPKWALNHLRPVLLRWKAHGIPLVLAGGNPSLAGELIIGNEANRLRNILKDNERAKIIALSLGFMSFHEFRKCTTKGLGKGKTTIEFLEDNIGKGKTCAVHLLSHQGRWTEEGEQGEIGDLCNCLGFVEHFGFRCEGTLLQSAKEYRSSKWTYGQGYDAFIVLGDKDEDKKKIERPARRTPKGKPLVLPSQNYRQSR